MTNSQKFAVVAFLAVLHAGGRAWSQSVSVAHARIGTDIQYFASDELEGRGVQTKGIELAAERILSVYRAHGLKPGMADGSYRQPFEIPLGKSSIEDTTSVVFHSKSGKKTTLELGVDFQPLRRGLNGACQGSLMFVGYGITSKDDDYDEYAGVDVTGKVLIMLRREPQQDRVKGAFLGTETSPHAYIDRKLSLAKKHGAAGVIFVNDPFTVSSPGEDDLSPSGGFGVTEAGFPFVHVKQAVVDELLNASPIIVSQNAEPTQLTSLQEIADHIDDTLQPVSQPLPTWRVDVTTKFDTNSVTAYNLIGVLEAEGPLADETIIIGGHYDHLGYGGYGSRSPNRKGEIHNGADDNASGTAAVLEMIRRITAGPGPKRRIVFICFSGEERGLLGSHHYVKSPVFPLNQTVTMLNFDMIGTVRNNRVEVNGVGTAAEFESIVQSADDASSLDVKQVKNPFGGSDHLPFYRKQVPVMFCFSGVTSRYHTPDDDFDAINVAGVVSTVDLAESIFRSIDGLPIRPQFQTIGRRSRRKAPFLGVMPDLGADDDEKGLPIQGVRPGSPAKAAGLQVGDIITQANESIISDYTDLVDFLRKARKGDDIQLTVRRNSADLKLNAVLGAPR